MYIIRYEHMIILFFPKDDSSPYQFVLHLLPAYPGQINTTTSMEAYRLVATCTDVGTGPQALIHTGIYRVKSE